MEVTFGVVLTLFCLLPTMSATIGAMKGRTDLVVAGLLVTPVALVLAGPPSPGEPGLTGLATIITVATWTVAGSRIGKPWSVWARTFYSPEKLAEAARRFPSSVERTLPPTVQRSPVPHSVEVGFWLLILECLATLVVVFNVVAFFLAGPAAAFAVMVRAGHRWGRTWAIVLLGLSWLSALLTSGFPLTAILLGLPLAAATVLLYRPAANRFFRPE